MLRTETPINLNITMPEDQDGYNAWTRHPALILQRLREAFNWLRTQQPVLNRVMSTWKLMAAVYGFVKAFRIL